MDNFAINVLLALAKPRTFDMVGICTYLIDKVAPSLSFRSHATKGLFVVLQHNLRVCGAQKTRDLRCAHDG
jgi:hypothetical protein